MKSIQHLLNTSVAIEVDVLVWMAVARQEFLNAQCVLRVYGADQHDVTDTARDQPRPPQEKRAHEDLAQIRVCLHYLQQLLVIHFDHFACFAGTDGKDRSPARQEVELARDLTGFMNHDYRLDAVGQTDDLEASGNHHKEARVSGARFHKHLAGLNLAQVAVRSDARNLCFVERGESMIAFRV